jgi:hypothetical protein
MKKEALILFDNVSGDLASIKIRKKKLEWKIMICYFANSYDFDNGC